MAQKWVKMRFGAIFLFFGYFFPIFGGRPNPIFFSLFFFLFRAGGPKWGLYQANRIATLFVTF